MTADPRPPAALRSALTAEQGITLSPVDAARIDETAAGARDALAKAVGGSLFDTEPAHFDRLMLAMAKGDLA